MSKSSAFSKAGTSQLPQKKDKHILSNPGCSNIVASNPCKCFKFQVFQLIFLVEGSCAKEEEDKPVKWDKEELVYADQGEAVVVC